MLVEAQMSQVKVTREYQQLLSEKETELRALRADTPDAAAAAPADGGAAAGDADADADPAALATKVSSDVSRKGRVSSRRRVTLNDDDPSCGATTRSSPPRSRCGRSASSSC